ncbi:MAG TPA: hypothetical protein ENJ00_05010 [Phycisphaerales bacterium]|nr:hypothetical protein [Phycisphaerales bacterium]
MITIQPGDMAHEAVHWWELAGHQPKEIRTAWRQVTAALRPLATFAGRWIEPQDDRSHLSLTWLGGQGLLDGLLVTEAARSDTIPMRAVLRIWDLMLYLVEESGSPVAETSLIGKTVSESIDWLIQTCDKHLGAAPHRPHPELAIEFEGAFQEPSQLAQVELIRLYANTSAILEQISWTVEGAEPVRTDPYTAEMMTQIVLSSDGQTTPPNAVLLGLAPSGSFSESGYWYVAPWDAESRMQSFDWPELTHGYWSREGDDLPIAVLAVEEVAKSQDPREQLEKVSQFFAQATNRSMLYFECP